MYARSVTAAVAMTAMVAASGCAVTRVETHVVGAGPVFCQEGDARVAALVLWGAAWRDGQKDIEDREAAAQEGIVSFFESSSCFSRVDVVGEVSGLDPTMLSDCEALSFARAAARYRYDRVILVRLEELGPKFEVHPSPILWSGGTEVAMRVRVLDLLSSALESDVSARWFRGGPFVVRGTGSLERDMAAALAAVLGGEVPEAEAEAESDGTTRPSRSRSGRYR